MFLSLPAPTGPHAIVALPLRAVNLASRLPFRNLGAYPICLPIANARSPHRVYSDFICELRRVVLRQAAARANGGTALRYAVFTAQEGIVDALLEHGADPNVGGNDDKVPIALMNIHTPLQAAVAM